MKKILLVEDDVSLGESLSERLSKDYEIQWVQSAQEAIRAAKNCDIDISILDIGLPDGSGLDVAKFIRVNTNSAFVFLTAQADAATRLQGFEIGADEFIPKPFHLRELLLRLKHVEENHTKTLVKKLAFTVIDFEKSLVIKNDKSETRLTHTEMKVLKLLLKNKNKVVSRDQIMDSVWGEGSELSHRTIDNMIVRIRSALSDADADKVKSVRGIGYQYLEEE
jgi:two-component system phosphate regulon response regulator PhoB